MATLRITLRRSIIGHPKDQKDTAYALGFSKLNQTVERPDSPTVRGMVNKIRHLVTVEELPEPGGSREVGMHIGELHPQTGEKKDRKRVGRGPGSGHGKTSTRGHKGQKARGKVRPGFEGGQTPLYRRVPKRRGLGQSARNLGVIRRRYSELNVGVLEVFEAGTVVTPELLQQRRVVKDLEDGLRVLGEGELTKALTVRAHHFSAAARTKIEAAGGTVEVI